MKENRIEFIKKLTDLIHMSRSFDNLVIEYGYLTYEGEGQRTFHRADNESDIPKGGHECLSLKWQGQNDMFARYQSIEADSCWAILIDAVRALDRM